MIWFFICIYVVISGSLFLSQLFSITEEHDSSEEINIQKIGAISIFWPFYLLFKLPQVIYKFLKFFVSSCKYFISDFFKIN